MTIPGEPDVLNAVDMAHELNLNSLVEPYELERCVLHVFRDVLPWMPVLVTLSHSRTATSTWFAQPITHEDEPGSRRVVGTLPSSCVRMVLAFVGGAIMRGQLYGGHIHRLVRVDEARVRAVIYMSNFNATGWWLRAYLFRLDDAAPESG